MNGLGKFEPGQLVIALYDLIGVTKGGIYEVIDPIFNPLRGTSVSYVNDCGEEDWHFNGMFELLTRESLTRERQ